MQNRSASTTPTWDLEALLRAVGAMTIILPIPPALSCTPRVFDSPGLPWKKDKNWYVFMVPYGSEGPTRRRVNSEEGIYRSFGDIERQLPGHTLTGTGVTCRGHQTLDFAHRQWAERCPVDHNSNEHHEQLYQKWQNQHHVDAAKAKAEFIHKELLRLYPMICSSSAESPPVAAARGGRILRSTPPATPARRRNTNRDSVSEEGDDQPTWAIYVGSMNGVHGYMDLKSAYLAMEHARTFGDVSLMLALDVESAQRSWNDIRDYTGSFSRMRV